MKLSTTQNQHFASFLSKSKSTTAIIYDSNNRIVLYNSLLLKLLDCQTNLSQKQISEIITEADWKKLRDCTPGNSYCFKISFLNREEVVCPLTCHIFPETNYTLLLGEKLMLTHSDILGKMSALNTEMVNLTRELQRKNSALEQANKTIKTLKGILPICSYCKGIRDDQGYWNKIERYISEHTKAEFSHSICPGCLKEHFPEMEEDL